MSDKYKPVVLVILDGWGVAPDSEGNAITRANLPNFTKLLKNYPTMTLHASGTEVGLMFGEMGNSEVGHLNIGAGRVYYQTLPRINKEIEDGSFKIKPPFLSALEHVKKNKSKLHLMGLIGNGSVHANSEHLFALLSLCQEYGLSQNVFVHAFLDGRDTVYNSGKFFVEELQAKMAELKVGKIASMSGRFYAMDRDNRWDRCEKAYNAIVLGQAERTASDPMQAIDSAYAAQNFDEEFLPTVITKNGKPVATVGDDDAVIFFNYRPDRARQLTKAFILPGFEKFSRTYLSNLYFVTMTEYEKDLPAVVAYTPIVVRSSLAEVVSKAGLKQLHVAETEKFAHMTFFLNGTIDDPFVGEDRILIPSPHVSNYAEAPEMSTVEIGKEVIKAVDANIYDLIAINFANADMVGHTGDMTATIRGCETIDKSLGSIVDHVLAKNGAVVITADHGNGEEVINLQTGQIDKEHSNNPVPFIVVAQDLLGQAGPAGDPPEGDLSLLPPVGMLADVAPTVLKLMGLEQPPEMTGQSLV